MQRKYLVVLGIVIVVSLIGAYNKGLILAPKEYPILSGPKVQPPKEVPALFSQSGTVIAMSLTSITIRYTKPAPTSTPPLNPAQASTPQSNTTATITFPISSATPVFLIVKETLNDQEILRESTASISDIRIGAHVSVQIAQTALAPVAPVKIQILPQ
jgi:hypothetical protein